MTAMLDTLEDYVPSDTESFMNERRRIGRSNCEPATARES